LLVLREKSKRLQKKGTWATDGSYSRRVVSASCHAQEE
jgi:inhibitor of KinA sporulation pathway (predicted exonuclease)